MRKLNLKELKELADILSRRLSVSALTLLIQVLKINQTSALLICIHDLECERRTKSE
jgi:hypothetical protein